MQHLFIVIVRRGEDRDHIYPWICDVLFPTPLDYWGKIFPSQMRAELNKTFPLPPFFRRYKRTVNFYYCVHFFA